MANLTGIQFSATQSYRSVEKFNFSSYRKDTENLETPTSSEQGIVSLGYNTETQATYNSSLILSSAEDGGYQLLKDMIIDIFDKQGISTKIATDTSETDISNLDPEAARELIAQDGYFGVEKTSERIFQFAIGIAGGDISRLDAIRQGVEDGFQEAKDAFNGWLPDISYDTYDAVMSKLDDWANGNNNQSIQI